VGQLDAFTPEVPLADPERTLYQAYATCFHWLPVGTVARSTGCPRAFPVRAASHPPVVTPAPARPSGCR